MVFIIRIHCAFCDSQYRYSKIFLVSWAALVIVLVTLAMLSDFLFVYGESGEIDNVYTCNLVLPGWLGYVTTFIDITMSILCVILFVRPLRDLISISRTEGRFSKPPIKISTSGNGSLGVTSVTSATGSVGISGSSLESPKAPSSPSGSELNTPKEFSFNTGNDKNGMHVMSNSGDFAGGKTDKAGKTGATGTAGGTATKEGTKKACSKSTSKSTKRKKKRKKLSRMERLVEKYTVTTFIAAISTFFLVFFVVGLDSAALTPLELSGMQLTSIVTN